MPPSSSSTSSRSAAARRLEDELTFYGCFHSRPGNQAIHALFVPPIMATLCVALAYARPASTPPLPLPPPLASALPSWVAAGAVPNAALLLIAAYAAYYIHLEPVAGASWAAAQGLPMWVGATAARVLHPQAAWKWSVLIHAASWLIQVGVGHGLIERRRPALTVSASQAFGTAALFAWLECLFALGYRKDLKARLDARVAVEQARMDRKAGRGRRGRR